nr:putative ribonuclease h protein [Quercus suber]
MIAMGVVGGLPAWVWLVGHGMGYGGWVDGSRCNPGLARGGGLIRDDTGKWVKGYTRAIGSTTSVAAELWALRDGIRLCIALKLQAVVFELDAKLVVDLLKKEDRLSNSNDNIVEDCKKGLKEIPMVMVQHCYREANRCADALARLGAHLSQDFVGFLDPSPEVSLLLNLDSLETLYDRNIATVTSSI